MLRMGEMDRQGFTLIEIVIAVAIVAIFAAAMTPMVFRHLEEAKISKAQNEAETIAAAVLCYYKDVGCWPYTNDSANNRPAGNALARVISSNTVAPTVGPGAVFGAINWANRAEAKQLGDYLYYNNADDDTGADGANANEANQDWPTSGPGAWRGPYIDRYTINDPWGHAYVINARFFPGSIYTGTVRHKVFVLSAGPNGKWETGYYSAASEEIAGDDIGALITITN
ncbi:hypothetical protein CSB20_10095 [bacterium DOLZORAL124_64_63]|nr:MAG: hypothetical protein CSB20_10095 [bacterium DOLZORAL124_64_63]